MCGIAGFHLKDPKWVKRHDDMEAFANLLLTGVQQRGPQASGVLAITADGKRVELDKRAIGADEFIKDRKPLPKNTQTVLLHTRWATKGGNEKDYNLHPVVFGSCFATHNGTITNDDDLFKKHAIGRNAEVDTEIIPALLDKFGWEAAGDALHELWGSFAIAVVDPIKHPGEVILAKGNGSPLAIYETDKCIVWCSLGSVIRDAWGAVIGTPPDWKHVKSFKEGQILHLGGKKRTFTEFEVGKRPFSNVRDIVSRARGKGSTSGGRRHPLLGTNTSTNRGVVKNRKTEIEKVRADGYGIARVFDLRDTYDKEQMLKDGNSLKYEACPSCRELLFAADFQVIPGEGRVCVDCYDYETHGSLKFVIDGDTQDVLTKWCSKEAEAHRLALESVSDNTGLDTNVIDYLVFRVSDEYTAKHANIADIAANLDDLYQDELAQAFDALFDEFNDEGADLDEAFAKALQRDDTNEEEGKTLFVKCDRCKKFKSTAKPCKWCEENKERAIEARPKSKTLQTVADAPKNCWCGEEATVLIGNFAGFCSAHYDRCNVTGCTFGPYAGGKRLDEPGPANHLRKDGKRICHVHARSTKGVWSDTLIASWGAVIQTLIPSKPEVTNPIREPGGL